MKRKQQQPAREQTPIADGDARPDQLDEKKIVKTPVSKGGNEKEKFTENRGADVNSQDNFRDAK